MVIGSQTFGAARTDCENQKTNALRNQSSTHTRQPRYAPPSPPCVILVRPRGVGKHKNKPQLQPKKCKALWVLQRTAVRARVPAPPPRQPCAPFAAQQWCVGGGTPSPATNAKFVRRPHPHPSTEEVGPRRPPRAGGLRPAVPAVGAVQQAGASRVEVGEGAPPPASSGRLSPHPTRPLFRCTSRTSWCGTTACPQRVRAVGLGCSKPHLSVACAHPPTPPLSQLRLTSTPHT